MSPCGRPSGETPGARRAGFPMRRWAALVSCGVWLATHAAPVGVPRLVETVDARAFGYQVGDIVQRHVAVDAPDGWRLDDASLPRPGGRGQALELRRVTSAVARESGGRRHELTLEYQVFLAPKAVRTIEIPAFRLHFDAASRSEEVLVEAWPVTVAPLVPIEVSPRRGLGELQPDSAPPPIDTGALHLRLVAWAVMATLLLAWLAVATLGPPWRAARRRPFGQAWRQLRRLPDHPPQDQWRAACRRLHEALNRCAGEVVFEHGLERFVAAQPSFAGLRDELARFLRLTRREFFDDAARSPPDAAWLVELCRRCRDAERGLA